MLNHIAVYNAALILISWYGINATWKNNDRNGRKLKRKKNEFDNWLLDFGRFIIRLFNRSLWICHSFKTEKFIVKQSHSKWATHKLYQAVSFSCAKLKIVIQPQKTIQPFKLSPKFWDSIHFSILYIIDANVFFKLKPINCSEWQINE